MAAPPPVQMASRTGEVEKVALPTEKLCDALYSIDCSGSFAASSKLKDAHLAPIVVNDIGPVEFPLSESTALQLIEKARQAPFGMGSETIVDTSVRNTWELDNTQFQLAGEQWTSTIDIASKWAAKKLGVHGTTVTAELYKMLIYENGALFKAHTDSEKAPGMFGTLVICLPSEHEGGDLALKHGGITKAFKSSAAQPAMFCWYSDVSHEVLPVTSGYRWVLTFNLVTSPLNTQPTAALNAGPGYAKVRTALSQWLDEREIDEDAQLSPQCLYFLLDHQYTEARLSLHALKGADLARMQCLSDVCDSLNVSLFLAVLEKEETGECGHDPYDHYGGYGRYHGDSEDDSDEDGGGDSDDWHTLEEVHETTISIKKLVNLQGRTLRSDIKIDMEDLEENLAQELDDPFDKAAAGESDYSGFTGNEGVSATHWYRMTMAVMVPNDCLDGFLIKGITESGAQGLLPVYLARALDPTTREKAMPIVRGLARKAWSPRKSGYSFPATKGFHEPTVMQFLENSLLCRAYELFSEALPWFDTKLGAQLYSIVRRATTEHSIDFAQVKDSLLENLARRPAADRTELLAALAPPNGENGNHAITEWIANEAVPSAVEYVRTGIRVNDADGYAIIDMVRNYRDLEYFKTSVALVLEEKARFTPFALAAMMRFLDYVKEGVFETSTSLDLSKILLRSILDAMDVTTLRSVEGVRAATAAATAKAPRYDYSSYSRGPAGQMEQLVRHFLINSHLLVTCLGRCIEYNWNDMCMVFSLKIVAKASAILPVEYHYLWIPFLRHMIATLEAQKVSLWTPRYQGLACAIFEGYMDRHIGKEPSREVDYRQAPITHHCDDCIQLSNFLQSDQRTWHFPAAEKRRKHLESTVSYSNTGCKCTTERRRSPYTLVVTKGLDSGTKARNAWKDRFSTAWDDISKFDQAKLKELLGEEFEKITTMRHLRTAESRAPLQGVRGNVLPPRPAAGVKRRAAH